MVQAHLYEFHRVRFFFMAYRFGQVPSIGVIDRWNTVHALV
jgi:hypothetical protein